MHGVLRKRLRHVPPPVLAPQAPLLQRPVHQPRALVNQLARAQRVVAHLAVAHVILRGQAHRRAVRLHRAPAPALAARGPQRVHGGRGGAVHRVPLVLVHILAPAVQDADQHGQAPGDGGVGLQQPLGRHGRHRIRERRSARRRPPRTTVSFSRARRESRTKRPCDTGQLCSRAPRHELSRRLAPPGGPLSWTSFRGLMPVRALPRLASTSSGAPGRAAPLRIRALAGEGAGGGGSSAKRAPPRRAPPAKASPGRVLAVKQVRSSLLPPGRSTFWPACAAQPPPLRVTPALAAAPSPPPSG